MFECGSSGSGNGELDRPSGIDVDGHGDIYVADWRNDRVQMFNHEGRYVQKFLGDATLSKVSREYMLTNASPNRMRDMADLEPQKYLRRPRSVAVDENGLMFVPDNGSYRVQVYRKEAIPPHAPGASRPPPLSNPPTGVADNPSVTPAPEPESSLSLEELAGYCNGRGGCSHLGDSFTSIEVTHFTHSNPRLSGATSLAG